MGFRTCFSVVKARHSLSARCTKAKDGPLLSIRTRELERKEVQKKNKKNKKKIFVSVKAYEKSMSIFMKISLKNVPAQQ